MKKEEKGNGLSKVCAQAEATKVATVNPRPGFGDPFLSHGSNSHGKSTLGCLIHILLYTVNYTYMQVAIDPRIQVTTTNVNFWWLLKVWQQTSEIQNLEWEIDRPNVPIKRPT
jgi:hypothetical protein